MTRTTLFVDVLLPLPLPGLFTYRVPQELNDHVTFGVRVVTPFGKNKLYSGLVVNVHETAPAQINTKYIIDIIDDKPIVSQKQFRLWEWIASYYLCHLGEVMAAALPSALKIASETKILLHPSFDGDITILTERELRLVETLSYRQVMTVDEVMKATGIKKIIPVLKSLVEKDVIITDEEIRDPYKPKTETYISLCEPYKSDEIALHELLDSLSKSKKTEKQADLILAFLIQSKAINHDNKHLDISIKKEDLLKKGNISPARLQTLIQKNVFEVEERTISRLADFDSQENSDSIQLSGKQETALQSIQQEFVKFPTVLLHGITGSGKTEIYIKLIGQILKEGKQVLYLLPEIALTSQIINRLRKYFGKKVGVYHSRFNEYERVEIWNKVLHHDDKENVDDKYRLILGARSALLLPFNNLGLIIVDEEHDASYKQYDPAPRYHARDSAIMLANIHKAKTLLGTATPSLESYYNTKQEKYGLVKLKCRFADSMLPDIWLVDLVESMRQKKMHGHFSQFLFDNIAEALEKKEQIILFQNRRGFSLRMFCNSCQSMPSCIHCDVTLTYHKRTNLLKCHYCGYAIDVPATCPHCHSADMEMKGFGTEKIEDSLHEIFPDAIVERMDFDTTRSKSAYQKLISDFENHKTDILVGTQMVTKGLDFDRVSVVGILNADNLISFPDFRAFERAFQMMAQVSGRAGRKEIPGKVIIQSYQPNHPALQYVIHNDYEEMYYNQIEERKLFKYPPVYRLIKITLKHKDEIFVNEASMALAPILRELFPQQVLGPEFPLISRIQNYYLKDFWIKLPRNNTLEKKKKHLQAVLSRFQSQQKYKSLRIVVNVDP